MSAKFLSGRLWSGCLALCCLLAAAPAPRPATIISEPKKAVVEALEDRALPELPDWYIEDLPLTYQEQEHLWNACYEFGVDHSLMLALIEQETGFHNVTGDGGDSVGYRVTPFLRFLKVFVFGEKAASTPPEYLEKENLWVVVFWLTVGEKAWDFLPHSIQLSLMKTTQFALGSSIRN